MLAPLDLTLVLNGPRVAGDYAGYRPLFYGSLGPSEFLLKSVSGVMPAADDEISDLANPLRAVHWLAAGAEAVEREGGMTPKSAKELAAALGRAAECGVSSRERSQLWYCLRSLGVVPEKEPDRVLGVILETREEKDHPMLLYASPDKSSVAVWEGGAFSWSGREEGFPTALAANLCRVAAANLNLLPRVDEVPPPPEKGFVVLTVVTPSGFRTFSGTEDQLADAGLADFYNLAGELLGLLCAEVDPALLGLTTLDLDSQERVFPPFSKRLAGFALDLFFYGVIGFLIYRFTSPALSQWGFTKSLVAYWFLFLLFPVLGAWMESSPAWGFRTLGKKAMGLGVISVDTSGGATFGQTFARNLAKFFLSPIFLLCGFVWAGFHRYGRAWHDVLSDTVVLGKEDPAALLSEEPDWDERID